MRGYKEHFFTPLDFVKISQIFYKEGLKTPLGNVFRNNHVHSIYQKGLIRVERVNRIDIVEVSDLTIEVLN